MPAPISNVCFLILPSLTATGWSQRSNGLPEAIEKVRPSVVQISVLLTGYSEAALQVLRKPFDQFDAGTGILVSEKGYVITAKHVMDGLKKYRTRDASGQEWNAEERRTLVGIAIPNSGDQGPGDYGVVVRASFDAIPAEEVAEDEVHDLALLKLQSNPFELAHKEGAKARVSAARFFAGRPDDGALIAVSGYPLHYAVLVTTSGTIASSWDDTGNADSYLADLHVNHGNSGGPEYRISDGSVIGMCDSFRLAPVEPYDKYGALGYNAGLSSIVPAKYIVDMLKKNGVAFSEVATQAHRVHAKPSTSSRLNLHQ
jgi:S1-C subfamily serine protease